jgi:chromosome segregation ATPase
MALVLREAELNRREATLRRAEEARAEDEGSLARASSTLETELEARLLEVERRERELQLMVEAGEAQRERLAATTLEYEERRDVLGTRAREVEAERNRLRDEQAQLVCASLALEDRERPAGTGAQPTAHASVEPVAEVEPEPAPAKVAPKPKPAPVELQPPSQEQIEAHKRAMQAAQQVEDTDWWTKQLGSPLEAASSSRPLEAA